MTLTDFIKRATPASLYAPTTTLGALKDRNANPAFKAASAKEYGVDYYLRGALAGGICCGFTHGAVTPVDVVKVRRRRKKLSARLYPRDEPTDRTRRDANDALATRRARVDSRLTTRCVRARFISTQTRIQLDPSKYGGMVSGFSKVIAEEGAGALLTGLGPTAVGYFIQGWFKFGGVEYFKINAAQSMTEQEAWDNRNAIYLGSAAAAEFIADVFLCPLEATRIRLVSNPSYAPSTIAAMGKMASEEGIIKGFYSGFGPILAKQVPYTMAKFAVQGRAAEAIYESMGKTPKECTSSENVSVSLSSGVIAGVVAAIISHPADTLLSKVNKAGAGGEGSILTRLGRIAAETGVVKLCTQGLAARCVMIGTLTAGQFGIFDSVMEALGASKFHFHNPSADH